MLSRSQPALQCPWFSGRSPIDNIKNNFYPQAAAQAKNGKECSAQNDEVLVGLRFPALIAFPGFFRFPILADHFLARTSFPRLFIRTPMVAGPCSPRLASQGKQRPRLALYSGN
jgi:hypothetical protein